MHAALLSRFGVVLVCVLGFNVLAGTFSADFNNGLPKNTLLFGDSRVDDKGGVDGSGVLKLTQATVGELGNFIIQPVDGKKAVRSFVATFKTYIGGGSGADGMAFHFAPDLPDAAFADPSNHGLLVVFDTFKNGSQIAPGIRVQSYKGQKFEFSVPELRTDHFVEVMIKLDPDGTVDVTYDNELVGTNLPTTLTETVGRFAFGARTGSRTDNHFVDDLKIATQTSKRAFVETFEPTGNDVSPSVLGNIVIREEETKVKPDSVKVKLDGADVTPEVSAIGQGIILVHFEPAEIYEPGTKHHVSLQFRDDGKPEAMNEFTYNFRISSQIFLSK